jgi:hypothetical protein
LKNNRLATKEAGGALATALAANSVLKELDLSSNAWAYSDYDHVHADGAGFAQELAVGMRDNRALSSLSLNWNGLLIKESGEALAGVLKANSVLTELDISSNFDPFNETSNDGAGFVQALAVGLIDNGALTKLDARSNYIGDDGEDALKNAAGSR